MPPDFLVDLPLVGWLFRAFFAQGPITISVLFLVIFLQIWLFRSRWGLRTRAVGEHPKAAETVGIDVIKCATGTSSWAASSPGWPGRT